MLKIISRVVSPLDRDYAILEARIGRTRSLYLVELACNTNRVLSLAADSVLDVVAAMRGISETDRYNAVLELERGMATRAAVDARRKRARKAASTMRERRAIPHDLVAQAHRDAMELVT